MRITFNSVGGFVKAEGDSIFQNSNNTNVLELVLPFTLRQDVALVSATFLLPYGKNSGQYGQYCPTSLFMMRRPDEKDVWYNTLDDAYLNVSGTAYVSAKIVYPDQRIKTTERVKFTIQSSGDYVATEVPPDTVTQLEEQILRLDNEKQDKFDINIIVADHTVAHAINHLDTSISSTNRRVSANTEKITQLNNRVDQHDIDININKQDIADLKDATESGKRYLGSITKSELPTFPYTSEFLKELNALASGTPERGDFVELYIKKDDKLTRYVIAYTDTWQKYDLQAPITKATNDRYGVLKGTANSDKNVKVNIIDGEIDDITYKDAEGRNTSIGVAIKDNDLSLKNIIDGTTVVPNAQHSVDADHSLESDLAIADKYGNDIDTTYAVKSNVYSKDEADEMFVEAGFLDINYISSDGITDVLPTQSEPQFSVVANNIGATQIFDIDKVLKNVRKFTKGSTDNMDIWVSASRDCEVSFKMTTYGVSGNRTLMAVETTQKYTFTANNPQKISINSIYNRLTNDLVLRPNDKLKKVFEVVTTFSTPTTFNVISNETYSSTFQFTVSARAVSYNAIPKPKRITISKNQFIDNGNGVYKATITPAMHGQPIGYYIIQGYYAKSNLIDENASVDFNVNITTGVISVYTSYPEDYVLLIASGVEDTTKGIVELENPTSIANIDYKTTGTIRILQTDAPTPLTLPIPTDTSLYYSVYVANDKSSTQTINVEGVDLSKGLGRTFNWSGQWTSSIGDITTNDVIDTTTGENLSSSLSKLNSDKQDYFTYKYEGEITVNDIDDFRTKVYNLRKNTVRKWQLEINPNNLDLMSVLGYPDDGISSADQAFLYIEVPYSEAGGFEIDLKLMKRDGSRIFNRTMASTLNSKWSDSGWINWKDKINTAGTAGYGSLSDANIVAHTGKSSIADVTYQDFVNSLNLNFGESTQFIYYENNDGYSFIRDMVINNGGYVNNYNYIAFQKLKDNSYLVINNAGYWSKTATKCVQFAILNTNNYLTPFTPIRHEVDKKAQIDVLWEGRAQSVTTLTPSVLTDYYILIINIVMAGGMAGGSGKMSQMISLGDLALRAYKQLMFAGGTPEDGNMFYLATVDVSNIRDIRLTKAGYVKNGTWTNKLSDQSYQILSIYGIKGVNKL